jgi:hypothetical protein
MTKIYEAVAVERDPIVKKSIKIDENSVKLEKSTFGKEQGKNGSIIDRIKSLGAIHSVDLIFADPYR